MQRLHQMTEELNLIAVTFDKKYSGMPGQFESSTDRINLTLPKKFVRPPHIRPDIYK